LIDNIQASWVKMGVAGVQACLEAGANDLGGTLMNESITRAAGAGHGQEWEPAIMESRIRDFDREPFMRDTLYNRVSAERRATAFSAAPLNELANEGAGPRQRSKRLIEVLAEPVRLPEDDGLYDQVVLLAACN